MVVGSYKNFKLIRMVLVDIPGVQQAPGETCVYMFFTITGDHN